MSELDALHKTIFGVEPVVIGLHWHDVQERIIQAIESGVPYNEQNELSASDLAAYLLGNLVF